MIRKVFAGLEDFIIELAGTNSVTQQRGTFTKINIDTLPESGQYGKSEFKSIRQYIDEQINEHCCNNTIGAD